MTRHSVPPAAAVPAAPQMFQVRVRLRTPLELEKERLGRLDFLPHFRDKAFRLLWGEESVHQDFRSATRDLQQDYALQTGGVAGAPITIPRAYYGTVTGEGLVSQDVVDTRSGESTLELGEYRGSLPSGMSARLWALDQHAPQQHFHPLVRIPLQRFDPPASEAASRPAEIWWRLWNLGQLQEAQTPSHPPAGEDAAAYYTTGAGRVFTAADQLARARWNRVRWLFHTGSAESSDAVFLTDLLRYHDGVEPPP